MSSAIKEEIQSSSSSNSKGGERYRPPQGGRATFPSFDPYKSIQSIMKASRAYYYITAVGLFLSSVATAHGVHPKAGDMTPDPDWATRHMAGA